MRLHLKPAKPVEKSVVSAPQLPPLGAHYDHMLLQQREHLYFKGTFREKVRQDLIVRPNYACGLLMAADIARFFGFRKILALEFGVANGNGLLNLCDLAPQVTAETGVEIEIIGFDTGSGLPPLADFRDHPEIWQEGDFLMDNKDELAEKMGTRARIIWGDVADTIPDFLRSIKPEAPIGFVSVDVDIYRSSKDALGIFLGDTHTLLPTVSAYFDDTLGGPGRIGSIFRNRFAGQLLAIEEFNQEQPHRKIDLMRILKYRRPFDREQWLDQMYGIHAHDHPLRNQIEHRSALTMREHGSDTSLNWPL